MFFLGSSIFPQASFWQVSFVFVRSHCESQLLATISFLVFLVSKSTPTHPIYRRNLVNLVWEFVVEELLRLVVNLPSLVLLYLKYVPNVRFFTILKTSQSVFSFSVSSAFKNGKMLSSSLPLNLVTFLVNNSFVKGTNLVAPIKLLLLFRFRFELHSCWSLFWSWFEPGPLSPHASHFYCQQRRRIWCHHRFHPWMCLEVLPRDPWWWERRLHHPMLFLRFFFHHGKFFDFRHMLSRCFLGHYARAQLSYHHI